ncbi:unnamed protein product [Meloidogyne enterolobii]|uniref:Uncharacterized protein n=1 Tax=Meloidogyne enterolobii TaxID=390850 RepID=A0ACB0ZFN2_MELEN
MLKDQGNKNKEIPTGKEKKEPKTSKNKLQARYNVEVKNKFSALNGLTEAKEKKLFNNEKEKIKKELKRKEKCEAECDEEPEEPSIRKSRKLITVTADPEFKCCKTHFVGVMISAFLACSGLVQYANLPQTGFNCNICKFENEQVSNPISTNYKGA